jgi:hypothetical protein
MNDDGIARWFVESAGFDFGSPVDPWSLAKRWGFEVRGRRESGPIARDKAYIWLDTSAPLEDQRESLATQLASHALILAGERGDPARVAALLLGLTPTRPNPRRAPDAGT